MDDRETNIIQEEDDASLYCSCQILLFFFFFTQMEGFWQRCIKQVYQYHFFQQHLLSSCLYVTFW